MRHHATPGYLFVSGFTVKVEINQVALIIGVVFAGLGVIRGYNLRGVSAAWAEALRKVYLASCRAGYEVRESLC